MEKTQYAVWQEFGPIYATGETPENAFAAFLAETGYPRVGDSRRYVIGQDVDGEDVTHEVEDGTPTVYAGLAVAPMTVRLASYVNTHGTPDRYRMVNGMLDLEAS